MKIRVGLLSALLLSLLFTACGQQAAQSTQASPPPEPTEAATTAPSPIQAASAAASQQSDKKLFIGLSNSLKEVPYSGEETPEALIAALAEETGWNLTLAKPVEEGPYENTLCVAFAGDSAIYTAPPDPQKDEYHIFDVEDLIYTVLNSTAETLVQNLELDGVYFASPDGGDLDFENGGYPFYLTTLYTWGEEWVREANKPLPEDSIGSVSLYPYGDALAGFETLTMLFNRENVQAGTGTVTVYDGEGNIFSQVDISDTDQVEFRTPDKQTLAYSNWKSGTQAIIWMGKKLQAGETYTVRVEAGALVSGDIKSKEIGPDSWEMNCLDYGIGETSAPGKTEVKIGEKVTLEIIFGDSVERAEIEVTEDGAGEVFPNEMTEDGTLTFTPAMTGDHGCIVQFFLKDGTDQIVRIDYPVVE